MNVEAILSRLRTLFEVNTNKELAECLAMSPQGVSGWIRRGNIPSDILMQVLAKKAVSLDWVVLGIESAPELSTHEKMVLIAFNQLSDEQKIDALLMMRQLLKSEPTQYIHQQGLTNLVTGDVKIG